MNAPTFTSDNEDDGTISFTSNNLKKKFSGSTFSKHARNRDGRPSTSQGALYHQSPLFGAKTPRKEPASPSFARISKRPEALKRRNKQSLENSVTHSVSQMSTLSKIEKLKAALGNSCSEDDDSTSKTEEAKSVMQLRESFRQSKIYFREASTSMMEPQETNKTDQPFSSFFAPKAIHFGTRNTDETSNTLRNDDSGHINDAEISSFVMVKSLNNSVTQKKKNQSIVKMSSSSLLKMNRLKSRVDDYEEKTFRKRRLILSVKEKDEVINLVCGPQMVTLTIVNESSFKWPQQLIANLTNEQKDLVAQG